MAAFRRYREARCIGWRGRRGLDGYVYASILICLSRPEVRYIARMATQPRDDMMPIPGPSVVTFGFDVLDRVEQAVAMVKERLKRAVGALDAAGIPHAVAGGNAVAAWVSRIDPAAVWTTCAT